MTDIKTDTCWADPLTRSERAELAKLLSRHCMKFFNAGSPRLIRARTDARRGAALALAESLNWASQEMAGLYQDVTERAELASDDPRRYPKEG